jgi:4-nitrophenyl phosphatase
MKSPKALLIDLDGTLYRGSEAIPGASDFIALLGERGVGYLFVTNRANRTPEEVADQLCTMGVPAKPSDILTSAQATATYLGEGRAFCIGEEGLHRALGEQGIELCNGEDTTPPDAVIVSYDRALTYEKITTALRYMAAGARFIATNPDPIITLEDGIAPETGTTVAALKAASGKEPEIVGKPRATIVLEAARRLDMAVEDCVMLGDNLDTDILAAVNAGMRSALILTGVSSRTDLASFAHTPTWVAEDYSDLTAQLFSS